MTEEIKQVEEIVEQEEIVEKQVSDEKENLSETELRAMKMGWRPKDEFADDEDYVDADEFIKRKPLFDKNAQLKSELRDVKKALREIATFQGRVREDERKRVLEELRTRKKQALSDGDAEELIKVDEEIADVRAQEIALKNTPRVTQAPHPEFMSWVEKNPWYAQDAEMRAEADLVGTAYATSNPDIDPVEVLKYVVKRMQRSFPERFRNPNRERPSAVEGSSKSSSKSNSKRDDFVMSDDEKRVMKTFVRSGALTEDEYISELKKVKGVA